MEMIMLWLAGAIAAYTSIFLLLVALGRRRTVLTRAHGPVETTFPLGTVDCERCRDGGTRFLTVVGRLYLPLIIVFGLLVRPFYFSWGTGPWAPSSRK